MHNRSLSELQHFLDEQDRPIDVLCVQEIISQKKRHEQDIDLDGSNQNQLSLFNRTSRLKAHAVFLSPLAGIIILRSGVILRNREIRPRLMTVQLTFDSPVYIDHTRSDQVCITSVYAPADPTARRTFFENELTEKILRYDELDEPIIMMGDFNDFELVALDR